MTTLISWLFLQMFCSLLFMITPWCFYPFTHRIQLQKKTKNVQHRIHLLHLLQNSNNNTKPPQHQHQAPLRNDKHQKHQVQRPVQNVRHHSHQRQLQKMLPLQNPPQYQRWRYKNQQIRRKSWWLVITNFRKLSMTENPLKMRYIHILQNIYICIYIYIFIWAKS